MRQRLTRQKAIRAHCIDCCCGSSKEVRLCACTDCNLYPYRLGYEIKDNATAEASTGKDGIG